MEKESEKYNRTGSENEALEEIQISHCRNRCKVGRLSKLGKKCNEEESQNKAIPTVLRQEWKNKSQQCFASLLTLSCFPKHIQSRLSAWHWSTFWKFNLQKKQQWHHIVPSQRLSAENSDVNNTPHQGSRNIIKTLPLSSSVVTVPPVCLSFLQECSSFISKSWPVGFLPHCSTAAWQLLLVPVCYNSCATEVNWIFHLLNIPQCFQTCI